MSGELSIQRPDAYLRMHVWPRCSHCLAVHPRAMTPPLDTDRCPQCGVGSDPGQMFEERAQVVDTRARIGMVFLRIAAFLRGIEKRMQ